MVWLSGAISRSRSLCPNYGQNRLAPRRLDGTGVSAAGWQGALSQAQKIGNRFPRYRLPGFLRVPDRVWGQDHVGKFSQRMISGKRLLFEDIKSGCRQFTGPQRIEQGLLLDQTPSGRIDEDGTIHHHRELVGPQHMPCCRFEAGQQDDDLTG